MMFAPVSILKVSTRSSVHVVACGSAYFCGASFCRILLLHGVLQLPLAKVSFVASLIALLSHAILVAFSKVRSGVSVTMQHPRSPLRSGLIPFHRVDYRMSSTKPEREHCR